MLRKITLAGVLGRKFGKTYWLDVESAAEAIRALCSQIKGIRDYLINDKTFRYKVLVGKVLLTEHETTMHMHSGNNEIAFIPVIEGSGGNVGGIITTVIGVALVAVGFFTFGATSTVGMSLIAAGAGMVLGGIMMLSMKVNPAVSQESEKNNSPSYNFNGAVNTTAQGQAIPVGYGRLIVGSAVISGSIDVVDIPI